MHFRYNIQLQKVGDTYIGVAVGKDKILFTDYLTFNETGYVIALMLKDDITKEEIVTRLLEDYEEERSIIEECVEDILKYLTNKGVIWTE